MSDINVNFTINQLNANLSIDPAPNVTLNIVDPMVANFYIEGTTGGGGGGGGTVTQVGGNGSGLGFSLAGNVTTTGNLTLTTPTDTALRTTLNIGNVANINLNGNTSQVLAGDGTWVAQGGGSGTVTSVNTSGSGLGFSLTGGPITTSGTVTLDVPTNTALRSSLNIGNVANINLNGNGSQVLAGNGAWVAQTGGSTAVITGSTITANTASVSNSVSVYLTTPLTFPEILTGMAYRVIITGQGVTTNSTANAIIELRCGNTGTISDTLLSNNGVFLNGGSGFTTTTRFIAEFILTFRSTTTIATTSFNQYQSTTLGENVVGNSNFVTVATPTQLGVGGRLQLLSGTSASFFLTQMTITRIA